MLFNMEMTQKALGKIIGGASALSLISYVGLKKCGTWSAGTRAMILTAGILGMVYSHSLLEEEKNKKAKEEPEKPTAEPIELEEITEEEADDLRKGVLEELNQTTENVELPKAEPIEVDEEADIEDFLPDNEKQLNRQLEDLFQ